MLCIKVWGGGVFMEKNSFCRRNMKYGKNSLMLAIALIGLVLIFAYSMGNVAAANTIYVNGSSGNDNWTGLNSTYIGGLNGPKASIKNATDTVTSGGTLSIANGVYTGAKNNNITISKTMTIKGQSKTSTIIQDTIGTYIFHINNGIKVNINDLTLTQGTNTNGNGGAINNDGTLTVNNSKFTGNTANYGGAIYNDFNLTVNNSTFTNNTAPNNDGGAIENDGASLTVNNCTFTNNTALYGGAIEIDGNLSSVIVNSSTFTGNSAPDGYGGAVHNYGILIINNSTFTNNLAYSGGAIYNDFTTAVFTTTMIINKSIFTGNSATYGGAINNWGNMTINSGIFTKNIVTDDYGGSIEDGGTATVNNSSFTDNTAPNNDGGAIEDDGNLTVKGSTFKNNTSESGGAIQNNSLCTVIGCTFASNRATSGGAIGNNDILRVNNTTFIYNSANEGGAIYNSGALTMISNVVTGNNANQGGAIYNSGSNVSVNYNQIYGNGGAIYNTGTMNATHNWWGSNNGPSTNEIYGKVTVTPWMVTPTVTSINPKNGAVKVPTNQAITIKFNETIKPGNKDIVFINSSGKSLAMKITLNGNTLIIKPTKTLSKGTKYTITLHSGSVTDLAGDPLKVCSYSFTTT